VRADKGQLLDDAVILFTPVTSPERSLPPIASGPAIPGIPEALLDALAVAAAPDRLALVGGAVRDLLLHRVHADPWRGLPDLDLVVEAAPGASEPGRPSPALRLAERLARRWPASAADPVPHGPQAAQSDTSSLKEQNAHAHRGDLEVGADPAGQNVQEPCGDLKLQACQEAQNAQAPRGSLVGRALQPGTTASSAGGTLVVRAVREHGAYGTVELELEFDGQVLLLDVASARRETYGEAGENPCVRFGSLADDLARRDFSINAMALHLGAGIAGGGGTAAGAAGTAAAGLAGAGGEIAAEGAAVAGEMGRPGAGAAAASADGSAAERRVAVSADGLPLLDPHGGQADLRLRRLRLLHDRSLRDDPTRLLRAARYAARLGFSLDPGSLAQWQRTLAQWPWAWRPGDPPQLAPPALGTRLRMELELLLERERSGPALAALQGWGGLALLDRALQADGGWRRRLHWARRFGLPPLAALLAGAETPLAVAERLQMPHRQQRLLAQFEDLRRRLAPLADTRGWPPSRWCALLEAPGASADAVALALCSGFGPRRPLLRWLLRWRHCRAETTAAVLIAAGLPPGPRLGERLRQLRLERIDREAT
jgi:poly(A) polymerase